MKRPVRRRDAVPVLEDPVAADPVGELVAVERETALVERLRGGDAARAGADQAGSGGVVSIHPEDRKRRLPLQRSVTMAA